MIHNKQVGAITNLQSGGAKSRGIKEAMKQLWPDGIPKGLSAKDRNNAIIDQLIANGSSVPKNPISCPRQMSFSRRPKVKLIAKYE
jgi:hypothetical protein